jgi:O-antigen/teichoic acid export membrane protein
VGDGEKGRVGDGEKGRVGDVFTRPPVSPSSRPPVSQPPVPASRPSRFSRHVAVTFGTRIVMIINSVLAGVIVARWLGVEGVGQLAVINVTITTLVQLGSLGLPSANTYFIAKNPNHFRKAAVNSFLFAMFGGSLLAWGIALTAQMRPTLFGLVSPELLYVAAISIPFQLLTLIGLNIFLAIGNVREFNLLDLLGQSFVLINSLVVLIVLHAGLKTLVAFNTMSSILVSLVIMLFLVAAARKLRNVAGAWTADVGLMGQMLRYGVKSHISIFAGALIFRADLLVVNHFRGAAEAGVYSLASLMALMLMLLPSVIATLLFPRVTAEQDRTGETTGIVTRHTAFIMLVCCLAAAPLSLLLPVLYGRGFADSSIQLMILLPGVFLIGLQSVIVQHFNAIGLPKAIPLFWVITLVVNIVLVFALVPDFGARGAAVASTISYALISLLMITYFLRDTRRSLFEVMVLNGSELKSMMVLGQRTVK